MKTLLIAIALTLTLMGCGLDSVGESSIVNPPSTKEFTDMSGTWTKTNGTWSFVMTSNKFKLFYGKQASGDAVNGYSYSLISFSQNRIIMRIVDASNGYSDISWIRNADNTTWEMSRIATVGPWSYFTWYDMVGTYTHTY